MKFIGGAVTLLADLCGLAAIFVADLPLLLKFGVGAALLVIPCIGFSSFFARKKEWEISNRYISELEQEVRRLRAEVARLDAPAREAI